MSIWGRLDPDIESISQWADQNPKAMYRLLSDPQLQKQLLTAMKSFDCLPNTAKGATPDHKAG
ncbi:MAG: hypothetical protein P1V97_29080 [Planctomycetota bacterium]|nr:hypothetical protein [Planctomycetota bacterium]